MIFEHFGSDFAKKSIEMPTFALNDVFNHNYEGRGDKTSRLVLSLFSFKSRVFLPEGKQHEQCISPAVCVTVQQKWKLPRF